MAVPNARAYSKAVLARGRTSVTLLASGSAALDRVGASLDAREVVPRTLGTLSVGESGEIAGIDGDGALIVRLSEMGFVAGTHVRLVKVAPLGDPLQLTLRGYHVSLRRAEAARIRIA